MSVNVQFSIIFMKHGFLALKCQHTGLDIKAGLKENKMGLFYKPVQRTFMFRVQPGVKCSQISERWNLNCMQKATMLYIFYFELQKGDLQKVQRLCSCVVQCIMHEDYPPPLLIKEVWNCIDHRCSRNVMPTCMAWLCLQASLEKQVLTAVEYSDNFPFPQGSTKRYIIPLTSQTTTCICSTAFGCIEQCYFLFYLRFVYKKTQNNHFQCAEIME